MLQHIASVYQEDERHKNINDIFIPSSDISIAEPYDVQIGELGNGVITLYQFIGDITGTKVGGLESLLNYMNETFYTKDNPLIKQHSYHITKKQYNEEANNIYNINKTKAVNIKSNRFLNNQYFPKNKT